MKYFIHRYCYLVLSVTLVMLAALPLTAKAQDTGVTATVGANIISLQSGPGLEFSSLGTAKLGDSFPVLARARGSNRVWYKVRLADGSTAWVSERVVNIDPAPDDLPWVGDNQAKTPLVMECGKIPPILFVGSFAQVIAAQGVILHKEPGIGKREVGGAPLDAVVQILDGPFCTEFSTNRFQIEWLVQTRSGVSGYMMESLPNGKNPFVKLTSSASAADFPAVGGADPNASVGTAIRPAGIEDKDIQTVVEIFDAVQNKTITQKETEKRLQKVVDDKGGSRLAPR